MKTIKVAEATELQLDWLVAKCEGLKLHRNALLDGQIKEGWWVSGYYMDPNNWIPLSLLNFSTNWAQGGPIIEREGIGFFCNRTAAIGARFTPDAGADWRAFALNKHVLHYYGSTPLMAAMRCYVTSKLGDTVEVPEDLA